MDPIFTHIITATEFAAHPEVFPEGSLIGASVELNDEAYAVLGLKLHELTEEDIANDAKYTKLGLTVGDKVELPIIEEDAAAGTETEATPE